MTPPPARGCKRQTRSRGETLRCSTTGEIHPPSVQHCISRPLVSIAVLTQGSRNGPAAISPTVYHLDSSWHDGCKRSAEENTTMKLITTSLCVAAFCASLAAQATKTEVKSKVTIKGGKDVKVTGCVQAATTGSGYVLTNAADKTGALG